MATLRIERPKEGTTSAYSVLVDNRQVGALENGDKKEFHIAPGTHILSARMDRMRSRDIEITVTGDEETIVFEITGYKRPRWIIVLFIIVLAANIVARIYNYRNNILFWSLFLPFVLLVFDLYRRRNDFIKLERKT